ncbi:MAG TPA: heptaprenyl diphosphate synthase [Lachnospiraceae bacterium]|nr:heptaprenyl diphosphate synthase [Lachnospiraceae bacterium]
MRTKKTAQIGMLVAVAFVLGYVESLLPISFGIPGIKLGLSNIVVLLCLYEGTVKEAFGIAVVRILLSGLTFGNLSTMMYSLAGGMLSFLVMLLLKKSNRFSIYGVSIAGGVSHNIGQIFVAVLVLQTGLLLYYLPFLLLAGCVAGTCIGFVGGILAKRLHGLF